MDIPRVPIAPLDIDEDAKKFLSSFSLEGKMHQIEAIGIEGNDVYVLGQHHYPDRFFEIVYNKEGYDRQSSFRAAGALESVLPSVLTLGLFQLTPWMSARRHKSREYKEKVDNFKAKNMADAEEKLKHIKVYQIDVSSLEKQLKKPLEIVDTGRAEQYLAASDTFYLRIEAYRLGADAISNLQAFDNYLAGTPVNNYLAGTPVKFLDDEKFQS